jgi:hypothetical protein
MVEGQRGEGGTHFRTAEDCGDLLLGEKPGQKVRQKFGCARHQLGRLQHDAIACRQRRDQRRHGELNRIIPGADDAHDADRLVQDARPARQEFRPTPTLFGFIQRTRCFRVSRAEVATGQISASNVSYRDRFPKSAEMTDAMPANRGTGARLMRPASYAAKLEVVGIGFLYKCARVRLEDAERNSILLRVVDRLLLGFEKKAHLRKHVIGAGPAHERIDLPRRGGLVLQHPFFRFCPPGLHGGFRWFINACKHDDPGD